MNAASRASLSASARQALIREQTVIVEMAPDEALAKMEHFCAYRERCPKEVRTKLAALGVRGQSAEQIYQVLEEEGFFNEERFAMAFAGGKFRVNHWGRVRIRIELRMRSIAPHLIEQALAAGLTVSTWTVNETERMLELQAMGLDSLITDYPSRALAIIQS